MKKLTAVVLTGALALALAGCDGTDAAVTPTVTPLPEDVMDQPATPPEGETSTPEGGTADTAQPVPADPDAELAEMVDKIYEAYPVELMMPTTSALDLSDESWLTYNAGLTPEQGELVDAGVLSESMTGSQAYSLVLLRLKDAADAQTVADTMLEKMDPARWVCVMADKMRVATFDDKVLFVMTDSELTDIDALFAAVPDALGVEFTYDKSADVAADGAMVPSEEEMNNPVAG